MLGPDEARLLVQSILLVVCVPALLLAAYSEEWHQALEAMSKAEQRYRLATTMSVCGPDDRQVTIVGAPDAAGLIRVSVSGCGKGLPADSLERVFEPFYTTKEHGLGMGLAICRSIVEAHGGRLRAANNPDRGAFSNSPCPRRASIGPIEKAACKGKRHSVPRRPPTRKHGATARGFSRYNLPEIFAWTDENTLLG